MPTASPVRSEPPPALSAAATAFHPSSRLVSSRPAWQRNPLFRFLSSVKLAVVLLSVVIIASIAGTLWESKFDATVARAYIYGAPWFNFWLLLLAVNLAAAAFSRWPWQRRHVGFLITHLGIIILLAGALIGRLWGIEGTMTLFKDRPPDNQLVVNERQLYVQENNGRALAFPVSIIGRRPTAQKPWFLGQTSSGWRVELIDYAPLLAADFQPLPVDNPSSGNGGRPAARMKLFSKRLNRTMENWLLADSAENAVMDLGMASIQLRRGAAPELPASSAGNNTPAATPSAVAPAAGEPVDESIMAFAQKPGQQVAQPAAGSAASGAKIRLNADAAGRHVLVDWRGATWEFDVDADRGKDLDLSGSGLSVFIVDYWPDFEMRDGKPASISAEPHNPAVLVRVHGHLPAPEPGGGADSVAAALAPTASSSADGANQAVVYADDKGALTYTLKTSAAPAPLRGTLTPGQAINTGWADWQLSVEQVIPHAIESTNFHPVEGKPKPGANHTEGVKVRLTKAGAAPLEEWVAAGWQVNAPTGPTPLQLAYGWKMESLPIGLQLTNFEVERNEGNADPAGFKSTLKITDLNGGTDTGSCWMNNPHNYPGHWWNTWSGLTFKISQASWNPENLNQSSVQILRDPGWMLKWMGSLLVCTGIFTLFYLRPTPGAAVAAAQQKQRKQKKK